MLLSVFMAANSVMPAFAEELTDNSCETAVASEELQEEDIQEASAEKIPVENTEEMPAAETAQDMPGATDAFSAPSESEPDITLETEEILDEKDLTDGSLEVLQENQEEMPEQPAEDPFGAGGHATVTAAVSEGEGQYDIAEIYTDEATGEILGVAIYTYGESASEESDPLMTVYWYAEDGAWTMEEDGEEYYIEPGVWEFYGDQEWNIQLVNEISMGQGGYVLDAQNHKWAYYLTAEDVQNTEILSEAWTSPEDSNFPAAMFIGAKGNLEKHAGLCTINGEQYYLQKDGTVFTDGKQNVDGKVYIFGADGKCTGSYVPREPGWVQRPDGYYWMQEDGTFLRTGGWQILNGQRYFLKYTSGRRASGWETWNKGKYYLDPETGVVVTGMKEIDRKFYYFNPTGNIPGKMHTGWRTIDGKKYYFQSNGMRKKGWLTINNRKYYFEKDGTQTHGWRSIGGKKYYFDLKNGFMRKGWLTIGKNKYYMEKDGSLHIGWRSVGGKKYYFQPKTGLMKKGWLTLSGKKYYFEVDGSQRYGWRYLGGKTYYFAPKTGVMQTGWLNLSGECFYLGTDGARCLGMVNIGGKSYYFGSDGKLLTNITAYRIDGKYYSIDKSGVLTPFSYAESLAAQKLDQIGWNLYAAFKWSSGQTGQFYYYHNNDTIPAGYTAADYYAIYGFENGRGDRYVMACTFYQMAKIMGYDVHFVMGRVPLARGGWSPHGWCEIDLNGTTYVCDPDFTWDEKRNGYMITYGTPGTWVYSDYRRVE